VGNINFAGLATQVPNIKATQRHK